MEKCVYIAHCIDTEGPLYEALEATFDRVYDVFGIKLEPSEENLKKLQEKKINLNGKEEAVANLVSEKRLNYNDNWTKIDKMLDEITSDKFRNELLDSFGNGWVYNWFCIDHVGFTGNNPRKRALGFHNVFDHYQSYIKSHDKTDLIQWHFHPLPTFIKDVHRCGLSYVGSKIIFEILARKIIDRNWFPAAYRAGFHAERPDSNWFLEQWIPFDFSNQAVAGMATDQPDLANGRFGDWRNAPAEWRAYHPDHDDYQKEGNCRRWIARCLNMDARLREINLKEVRDGFKRAASGKPTLICFTDHDFRNMKPDIDKVRELIKKVSEEFPDVKFKYCSAIEGIRSIIGVKELKDPKFDIKIERAKNASTVIITSDNDIFGPQPFFAIKTKKAEYYWDDLDFQGKNKWSYTFDFHTIDLSLVDKIGIAANTNSGVTEILTMDPNKEKIEKSLLNGV